MKKKSIICLLLGLCLLLCSCDGHTYFSSPKEAIGLEVVNQEIDIVKMNQFSIYLYVGNNNELYACALKVKSNGEKLSYAKYITACYSWDALEDDLYYNGAGDIVTYPDGTEVYYKVCKDTEKVVENKALYNIKRYSVNAQGKQHNIVLAYFERNNTVTTNWFTFKLLLSYTNYFYYDSDKIIGFNYNGASYTYVKNLKGDVVTLVDLCNACLIFY